MLFFTGQYERSIDSKKRVQLPATLRGAIVESRDGAALYVTLGERRRTLSILTERGFEALASRMATEYMPGPESRQFELQFYASAVRVEMDKQGRIVLPERLVTKARLGTDVVLVGQKNRIDVWNRLEFERSLGIDWEGDDWPDWKGFLRMRPGESTND